MRNVSRRFLAILILSLLFHVAQGLTAGWGFCPAADNAPLTQWNEGKAKKAIIDFVEKVCHPNSKSYVPPEERIAT